MMEWIIGGVVLAAFGAVITLGLRNARKRGEKAANERSEAIARDAENQIHDVQAEHRDPQETKRRLDEGSF